LNGPSTSSPPPLANERPRNADDSARGTGLFILLLVVAILATYAPAFHAQFLRWDDEEFIYHDPHLNPPDLSGLEWHWKNPEVGIYTPVTYTIWWLLARLPGGIRPLPYHLTSVAAHCLASSMVFVILRRLTSKSWPALAGALLFAIHPLQVESVLWASGLKDVLSGALSLTALALYLNWARNRDEPRNSAHHVRYAAALAIFVLALLCKPSVMSFPLVAAAIEIGWLGNSWRRATAALLPFLLAAIPLAVVARNWQPAGDISNPVWARPLIALDALAFYLYKLVFPQSLGIVYGRQPKMVLYPVWHGIAPAFVTWIVPVAIFTVLVRWRRRREIVVPALVFVLALLPMLGLAPFMFQKYSTVADHYLYVAMLGPAMLVAAWLAQYPGRKTAIAIVAILAVLSIRSFTQAQVWHDDLTLFRNAIAVDPSSAAMHRSYGVILNSAGDVAGATEQYLIVLALQPDSPEVLKYVADAKSQMGDGASAARFAQQLIDLQLKIHPDDRAGLAYLFLWRGEICQIWGDSASTLAIAQQAYQQAVDDYQESMKFDADNLTTVRKFVEVHQKLDALNQK